MKYKFILIIIFSLGLFLRLFNLASHPVNLNRDELAIGYNAYSLINTSYDEHGQGPWPLAFESFGDYKLPGLIYMTTIPVKLYGLNAFSVRLPNAIFGSLLILIVYFLAKEIFKSKKAAIYTSIFIALSYWHIHGSRSAYEPIVALTLSTASFLFLLKSKKRPIWLFLTILFSMLSFYIYNSPLIIVPLILISYLVLNRKYYFKNLTITLVNLTFFILGMIVFIQLTKQVSLARSHTTVFVQPQLVETINQNIHYLHTGGWPLPIARMISNKPTEILLALSKNYLSAFNPTYLFATGDDNPWHNLVNINIGNLNLIFLPLFLFGLYQLKKTKIKSSSQYSFLWLYLLFSPIPNAICIDSPVTNRLMDFHLSIILISVFGLMHLSRKLKFLTLAIYFGLFTYFIAGYWFIHSHRLSPFWEDKTNVLMYQVKNIANNYDRIYITNSLDVGYIFLVFYYQYDPALFQSQAGWVNDGFTRVVSLDKYSFDQLGLKALAKRHESGEKILVVNRQSQYLKEPADVPITIKDNNNKILWSAEEIIIP